MGRPWIDRLCAWLDLIRSRRLLLRNRELRDGVDEARAQAEQMSYKAREDGRHLVIGAALRSWHEMVVFECASAPSAFRAPWSVPERHPVTRNRRAPVALTIVIREYASHLYCISFGFNQ